MTIYEADMSGNLRNGTVTGATLYGHAPIGRYTPTRRLTFAPLPFIEYINVTDSGVGTEAIAVAEGLALTDSGVGNDVLDVSEWVAVTDSGVGTEAIYFLGELMIDGLRLDHALRVRVSEPTTVASKPVSVGLPTRLYLGRQGRTLEIEGWVNTIAELNTIEALADGAVHEVQLPTGSRVSVHITDANPVRPIEPGEYPYTIRAVERMD